MEPVFSAEVAFCSRGYVWRPWEESGASADGRRPVGVKRSDADAWLFLEPTPLVLTDSDLADSDEEGVRRYNPFQDAPALFVDFSELDGQEAILAFANRWGALETHEGDYYSLANWKHEIARMKSAIDLYVEWGESNAAWDSAVGRKLLAVLERIRLDVGVVPVVVPGAGLSLEARVSGLLAAVWFQFAVCVAESTGIRKCAWTRCPKHFLVLHSRPGRRRGRTDREFCSDSCRVKSYLHRRETAARLRAEGKKLREIAREVSTDLDTLKKWLAEDK